jgi:hypothetical protein
MHLRHWTLLATLCIYVVWTILNHEVVQGWLAPLVERMGRPWFYLLAGLSCGATGLGLSWLLWRRTKHGSEGRRLRSGWAFSIAGSGAAAFFFMVNNSELAHFLQYAIFGAATYCLCRHIGETVAWGVLVGLADEGYQYLVLHDGWGIPWDFNDITLNLFGAALGAILAASYKPQMGGLWWKRPGIVLLASTYLCMLLLWLGGKMTLYEDKSLSGVWFSLSRLRPPGFWFFDASWGPRTIHMLSPVEGPLLLLALVGAYIQLDRGKEQRS